MHEVNNHEENELNNITSEFTYNESFQICKNLDRGSNKLKYFISTSKTTLKNKIKVY